MSIPIRYIKILFHEGENIEFYGIYQGTKDGLFRMRVKCDYCDKVYCRCFETIEEAMGFEGFICSNRCFALSMRGDDEDLDALIEGMELGDIPLELLPDSVFDELVSGMDDALDAYDCPMGDVCPVGTDCP